MCSKFFGQPGTNPAPAKQTKLSFSSKAVPSAKAVDKSPSSSSAKENEVDMTDGEAGTESKMAKGKLDDEEETVGSDKSAWHRFPCD